jgi:hypothetical protein
MGAFRNNLCFALQIISTPAESDNTFFWSPVESRIPQYYLCFRELSRGDGERPAGAAAAIESAADECKEKQSRFDGCCCRGRRQNEVTASVIFRRVA